jgi:uncharacterized protein YbjT (DUF2867 family)
MICVTGAGGTLSSEVIRQLEGQKIPFRGAYFSEKAAAMARARRIEAVTIDYNHPATLHAAFQDCDAVFLLGPNALNQTELELNAVDAARAAGVSHIVKQSVMGAAEEAYSLAKIHRPVEKAIETSGMAWTFLRPNSFMQNAVTFMAPTIRGEDAFYSASGEARISHVDVRDIAAVAVAALTTRGRHAGRIYTLTGADALTYDEMAAELSKALGRVIRHVGLPVADLKAGMLAEGMPESIADRMLDLERLSRGSGEHHHRRCEACDRTRTEAIRRLRAGHGRDRCVECGRRVSGASASLSRTSMRRMDGGPRLAWQSLSTSADGRTRGSIHLRQRRFGWPGDDLAGWPEPRAMTGAVPGPIGGVPRHHAPHMGAGRGAERHCPGHFAIRGDLGAVPFDDPMFRTSGRCQRSRWLRIDGPWFGRCTAARRVSR